SAEIAGYNSFLPGACRPRPAEPLFMSVQQKVPALFRRFGRPAAFAVRHVLEAVLPGSPALIELVGQVLDCARETSAGQFDLDESGLPAIGGSDLKCVEDVLDVLGSDLQTLLAQVAAFEKAPELADQVLEVALATDDRCRVAVRRLCQLAVRCGRLDEQDR